MNEIRERVRRLVAAMPKMTTTQYMDESRSLIADLLAELERVEKERDDAMREASSLAKWLHKTYYALTAPDWSLCDTPAGVITQIDNMVTGIPDLVDILRLEAENNRLNTLLHKASKKSAEDFTEYIKEARTQAVRECVEIIDKYPAFLFGTDAVGVKLNLSQGIKAHFKLEEHHD